MHFQEESVLQYPKPHSGYPQSTSMHRVWTITLSKRKAKSTWTQSPVVASNRMFSPCRSPKPTMWPTMDQTAVELVNVSRAWCHVAGSGKRARNQRCSTGGYSASSLSKSSLLRLPYMDDHKGQKHRAGFKPVS